MLFIAAVILVIIGLVHSYLGERYILTRLFKRDNIPQLFGSSHFTKGTLRFCWHVMTLTAFGFAAILANSATVDVYNLKVIGIVFLLSGLLAIFYTKGRHLSWIAFFTVSALCFIEAYSVF